jgi:hypothetical protein|tara:strand:- start:1808 stop:2089 length:282 start_codon:yes stop_codon:yes gene_type:complete
MSITAFIVDQELAKTSVPTPDPTDGSPVVLDDSLHNPDEDCWWDGTKDGTLVDNSQHRKHVAWIKRNATTAKEAGHSDLAEAWSSMITCCCAD